MKKIIYFALLSVLLSKAHLTLSSLHIDEHLEHNHETELNKNTNNKEKRKENNDEPSLPYLDTEAAHYFYGLTENYPKNYKGTCAFVAISMLLQYYDTFWDDNIIPEVYEQRSTSSTSINDITVSPGVKADSIPGYSDNEARGILNDDYYDIVMSMKDNYFQPYLFWICDVDDLLYLSMNNETSFASLNELGREVLVNTYLQEYRSYTSNDYTFETIDASDDGSSQEAVRNYTINKIKQGIPVLMCMAYCGAYHAFIAYDYDEETDFVYGHYGDFACDFHFNLEEALSYYWISAQTLTFHTSHNHSNNYGLVGDNNQITYFCGCQLAVHNHRYTYTTTGVSYHRIQCFCGTNYLDRHYLIGTGHIRHCMYCNQIVDITQGPIISMKEEEIPENI